MRKLLIRILLPILVELATKLVNRMLHNRLGALLSLRKSQESNKELEMKIVLIHELIYINDNLALIKDEKEVNYEVKSDLRNSKT